MPPSKIMNKMKQNDDHKVLSSPKRISNTTSGKGRDDRESSVTQILSQRLNNMEQQLLLLRSDLKEAIDTLKRKDQEIITLENKIALAERRRDSEKSGSSPNEILSDLSEDVDPESKSKQELLQKECDELAQKLQEMEKFFGDYGLLWVKEDAIDERDPNNLWVRKTNIHYTPDFDKVFLVVEELNVGNAEPQIVKTGNTAQFKTADLLNLTIYADGIQLENNPLRLYDSPSVEEFFRDLEDGYFPAELKGQHPEGVIFKVKDMRNTRFADDPHRRPVGPVKRGPITSSPPRKFSASSVPHQSSKLSPEKDGKNEFKKDSKLDANKSPRRSKTLSQKGSTSSRRSIIKNTVADAKDLSLVADRKLLPQGPVAPATVSGNVELDGGIQPETSGAAGDPTASPGGVGVPATQISPGGVGVSGTQISPGQVGVNETEITPGKKGAALKTIPGGEGEGTKGGAGDDVIKTKDDVADSAAPSPGPGFRINNTKLDPPASNTSMKQLFVGNSPTGSTTRVPTPLATNIQKIELDKELTKDSFGLPRPPLSPSVSYRSKDPPNPTRPPSKHFDNYFLNKAEETQTSGTYVMAQPPQPQPTQHITNITYNEAPITIQMTPSELKGTENKSTPTPLNICPSHHPHPCNCAHGPPKSTTQEGDGSIRPIGLIRIPGETEYREKYAESAANSCNVLQQKKKTPEECAKIPSPDSTLAARDVAPIPPDALAMGNAFDPNVQWPNFKYLGHPKGQEIFPPPPPTPVSQPLSPKKESDSRQIIQLNEKTSDRMISVKMQTRSGSKEYVAHLYPDEPANKLRSLLKMNAGDTLTIENEGETVSEQTHVPEISSELGRQVVVSKFGDRKPKKQFYPERRNLGSTNPDLFKNYPGEIEVKKRKNKGDKKKVSIESVSSENISMKSGKSEDDNESRDLVISRYENRDWLTKEVHSKKNVPRVTSRELQKMSDGLKKEDVGVTTVPDIVAKQTAGSESDLPPKIVSEDAVSVERTKVHKSNYSSGRRTEKDCEIFSYPMVSPRAEKSRSSSLISESQCPMNSFVAEPQKKAGRRNIHESTSSLNIVGMDRTFSELQTSRDFAGPSGSRKQEKHRSLRVSPDTSIFTEPDKCETHSLIFRRKASEESSEVAEKESSHGGLNIESLDTISRTSETSFCYSCTCRSRSDVDTIDHTVPTKTRDATKAHTDPNAGYGYEEELSNSIGGFFDDKRLTARASSGIRSDGFEAATLLEILDAMLRAKKEYDKEQLRHMKRDGVLVRKNSSDASMSIEFVPPSDVVEELEKLKRYLGSASQANPPPCHSEESSREHAERLLEELLSRKSSPDEIIRKIEARKDGSSTVRQIGPEVPQKRTDRKQRGRVNKKPTKSRERHKEFTANLYPEEPIKKLWSLLKLNAEEYSLTTTQAPHIPLRRGSVGDHLRDNDLSLVLSKTKANVHAVKKQGGKSSINGQPVIVKSDVKTSSTEGITKKPENSKQELRNPSKGGVSHNSPLPKATAEVTTTSKEGTHTTNVNISINVDSPTGPSERAQVPNVEQSKQKPMNIEESMISPEQKRSSSNGEFKKKAEGSDLVVSPSVQPQKKPNDPESQHKMPITPNTRARALSERLSQMSLRRKSFQSVSHRDSAIKGLVQPERAVSNKEGRKSISNSKENETPGSKELLKTSPHSSTNHVGDKVNSSKNLLNNREGHVTTSKKEHVNSITSNKTISSSQSFNKTSIKRSLVDNLSSKSSIGKKVRKGSSKSLIAEEANKSETSLNHPSRSPEASRTPEAPTIHKIGIHPSPLSSEQEKLANQTIFDKDSTSERKSSGLKNNEENNLFSASQPEGALSSTSPRRSEQANKVDRNSPSVDVVTPNEKQSPVLMPSKAKSHSPGRQPGQTSTEETKIDQKTSDITSEQRVSSDKGISQEKHDLAMTPGRVTSQTDKHLVPEKYQTRNDMETDAQHRSPDHEIVTSILSEMVGSFHRDASKGGSAGDDRSVKPDDSPNRPETAGQDLHPLANTMERMKSMSPPETGITVNNGDVKKLSDVHPITNVEEPTIPLKEGEDGSKLPDNPIISEEGATFSLKENKDIATPNVNAPNAEPPRIEKSDADTKDEEEAKVSSVNHSSNHEYDKHDSEQEFKRETPTGTPTITTTKEDKKQPHANIYEQQPDGNKDKQQPDENIDKHGDEPIVKPKNGTSKGGNNMKKRKSSQEDNDEPEKRNNSQERNKSDGNEEKNEDLVSPVISKEDVAPDIAEAQNVDDTSESSLT